MNNENRGGESNTVQPAAGERPISVTISVRLLIVVVLIGVFQSAVVVLRHIDVRDPTVMVATKAVLLVATAYLLYRLYKGTRWARVLLVIILLFAIPLTVLPTLQSFSVYPLFAALEVIQVVLFLVALGLLFRNDASRWFSDHR